MQKMTKAQEGAKQVRKQSGLVGEILRDTMLRVPQHRTGQRGEKRDLLF